ncbi:MAG: preprotein translocase subunit SecE [Planctomycetota bacterium]
MLAKIYKPGQGKYTRLCSGLTMGTIIAFGCWRLYEKLGATDWNLWIVSLVPVGVFAVLGVVIYWLLNKPSLADFLIAAEGELKKVNWSSRREVFVSTVVVIIVVVAMAVLLGTTDLIFTMVFSHLLG